MPTLLELFASKKYESLQNKTPQEAFDIRNSKEINISSNDFALNKVTPAINKLRLNRSDRLKETRAELEDTGLYPYANTAQLALYGTDILRITSKSTPLVEAMKSATGGGGLTATATRILSDTTAEAAVFGVSRGLGLPATFSPKTAATKAAGAIKNKLGSIIPDVLIPSKIVTNPLFNTTLPGVSEEYRTHELLASLKAISEGTKLGTFLARNASGTPNQIKTAIANQGLNILQEQTKKFVSKQLSNVLSKGGEKAQALAAQLRASTAKRYSSLIKYSEVVGGEKTFGQNDGLPANKKTETNDNDAAKRGLDLSIKWDLEYSGEIDNKKRGKLKFAKEKWASDYSDTPDFEKGESYKYSKSTKSVTGKKSRVDFLLNDNLSSNDGFKDGLAGKSNAILNLNDEAKQKTSTGLLFQDYIPIRFISVPNNTAIHFRGTITGFSEQFSPSWDNTRFIGSPFNFYTYQSIERTVQFTFKVYALNSEEHKTNWTKLGYLASLCYPQSYEARTGAVSAPFLKVTIGDLFRNKACFIENMTYNVDDNYPWEVGLNSADLQSYRAPMIVEVTLTLKFVEARLTTFKEEADSKGAINTEKIGGYMYGVGYGDKAAKAAEGADKDKFKSTNSKLQTTDLKNIKNQSAAEQSKNEGKDPWPQDNNDIAEKFRKENKLTFANIYHTPIGASTARKIYRQKKTGYLYYGDGTPYTSFPKNIGPDLTSKNPATINDVVPNPFNSNANLG